MERINSFKSGLSNPYAIPVTIFANAEVEVEKQAVEELRRLLDLQETLDRIQQTDPDFFGCEAVVEQVAVTPDFHKGSGVPIGTTLRTSGFLLPQAIGKDINCGMRLYVTDVPEEKIRARLPELTKRIRHVYFEGGRQLPLSPVQKKALLQYGLQGLLETHGDTNGSGLWKYYDALQQEKDLQHVIDQGSLQPGGIFSGLENYTKIDYTSYDAQLGSIGGGNHFVEVQRVADVFDGATAYAWNLKKDAVVVMIHTGSVSVGYPTAVEIAGLLRKIYPATLKLPANGMLPLPLSERYEAAAKHFFTGLHNAANFAFANRMFLGMMMQLVFDDVLGGCNFELLYDSGHNMVWNEMQNGKSTWLHRKGACPARGAEQMQNTPFAWTGEPALVPGSMGATSFILAGCGNAESNSSASHGAGRSMSRGDALKVNEDEFNRFLKNFHIITPIDPQSHALRGRQDIITKWHDELKKEAPFAFKPVKPVIDTQTEAGIVRKVVEVEPIFTVKG